MRNKLLLIAIIFVLRGLSQEGNKVIDSLEKRIATLTHPDDVLKEKAVLLLKYFTSGQTKKSEKFYKESLAEAHRIHSEAGIAALLHTKGTLFYYESKFDSSLFYFERALSIRKKIKDNIGILKSTSNIGSIYFMLGEHKKALVYYNEGQKKEAELKYEEGKYISINNLGTVYNSLRMHDEALKYFRKAEKIYLKNKATSELTFTYEGLANVYKDLKKPDSALFYSFKSLNLSKTLNDGRSMAYSCMNIAIFNMDLKKYELAKRYIDTSLKIALEANDKRLILTAYGNLAAIELKQKRPDSALKYMDNIITLQKELEIKNHRFELAELFARYYYDKKDYEKTFQYLDMQNRYKDSLYNIETASQISEMQAKYETEKKEKENQLLQAENNSYRATRNYLLIILTLALVAIIGAILAYRKIKNSKIAIEQKNELLEEQKKEIIHQKEIVDEKQKEILDSINYARRIQFALLASESLLQSYLPEHFVLFKPKDVVSGDFYWAAATDSGFIYVTADCTGHGVPGAFMSLLNITKLSQAINEKNITRPDLVLNEVRAEIIKALNPKGSKEESKDGMDAIICKLDIKKMKLEYAAANNSFYIVRNKELLICKADKMPVGKGHDDNMAFSYNEITLQKGDIIYTLTDGFADQFGGNKGKKFKYKQFEEFLLSVNSCNMSEQKQKLDEVFENWKGKLEQVDDICVIGVKIT